MENLKKVDEIQLPEFPNPFDGMKDGLSSKEVATAKQKLFDARVKVFYAAYAYQKAKYSLIIAESDLVIQKANISIKI